MNIKKIIPILIASLTLAGCTAPAQPTTNPDSLNNTTLTDTSDTTTSMTEPAPVESTSAIESTSAPESTTLPESTTVSATIANTIDEKIEYDIPEENDLLFGYLSNSATVDLVGVKRTTTDTRDLIVIHYEMKNNSKENITFARNITDIVYQNGTECERAIDSKYSDAYSQLQTIKPGETLLIKTAFAIDDINSNINLVVKESFTDNEIISILVDKNNNCVAFNSNDIKLEETPEETSSTTSTVETPGETPDAELEYVITKADKKIHIGSCVGLVGIDSAKMPCKDYEFAIEHGYYPCEKCKPDIVEN